MRRLAFTMIELVFVIVVMGIIGKFGVEFLAQAYKGFIFSNVNHTLQSNAEMAVESIAKKLQYRIKDSLIKRKSATFSSFEALGTTVTPGTEKEYNILEWVATDIDSYRGNQLPYWSGIIDLDASSATLLNSPETNTTAISIMISKLSNTNSNINNAAIYFIGSDSDINNYGWNGTAITTQNAVMHPIRAGGIDTFVPTNGDTGVDNNFNGIDVFEYYQLAWTAYAIGIDNYDSTTKTGTLTLWYDYQPWEGDKYTDNGVKNKILMENVSTFQFKSVGSVVKIQVCVNSKLIHGKDGEGGYSLCKEKTIF